MYDYIIIKLLLLIARVLIFRPPDWRLTSYQQSYYDLLEELEGEIKDWERKV